MQVNKIEPDCNLSPVIFSDESRWYTIDTYSQKEMKVVAGLDKRKIETFVPLKTGPHHRKAGQLKETSSFRCCKRLNLQGRTKDIHECNRFSRGPE